MQTKGSADVEAAAAILSILSQTVLEIGEILEQVYVEEPTFTEFVIDHLPLQPVTAQKMRAMYLVHAHKNGHVDLPEPWKACWAFG